MLLTIIFVYGFLVLRGLNCIAFFGRFFDICIVSCDVMCVCEYVYIYSPVPDDVCQMQRKNLGSFQTIRVIFYALSFVKLLNESKANPI